MNATELEIIEHVEVTDWRGLQPDPPPLVRGKRKHRVRRTMEAGRIVEHVEERDPKRIDGIVLHQTACSFGPSDDANARHRRALGVACHALAFRDGAVVLANPLRWTVLHGNGLNDRSLGLEVEGLYSGLEDDPSTLPDEAARSTWGGRPDVVSELLVAAGRRALRELVERGRAEGMPIRYVWAHRQSSRTRRSDPGAVLWRRLIVEYAQPVLGLVAQPSMVLQSKSSGPGRPIPAAWGGVNGVPY